ncbi:MAG TPA: TIGR03435 family protein [Vicinamibacterales bacterium]|nr:TIGR03435 family protein [Vicinamibacterales bacterium]
MSVLLAGVSSGLHAMQTPASAGARFETISIKLSESHDGGGMRTMPDGTFVMTNQPIRSIILAGSPVPVREAKGLPDWVDSERYDITAKPPAGSTRQQHGERLRNLLVDRLKLAGHVEEQDGTTYALVVASSDGSLGPQMKLRTTECPPCGARFGPGVIEANGITMATFVGSISGLVGGQVIDKTGLEGRYDLTMHFASPRPMPNASADAPGFVDALRSQLGLAVYPEASKVQVFVVDHLERPVVE